jgi:23S rRNA (guanosine2251-2'-O)-methyltransferase
VSLGAKAIVWPEHHSAPLSAATFRASAGAVEHAVLCRVPSLPDALKRLHAKGLGVIGLDAGAKNALYDVLLTRPVVLVVGAEGKGLRKTVRAACDELARLPMRGPVASLNASVALAIALYETLRQRSASRPA